ncbi:MULTISPECIES: hypothetical protein [Lacrimispora]|jgi:hypothetical protein|nr:hypothetical protein [Lacrimispora amygdalina]MDK2967984.1 hypothetical protein [Lacrimispora sp.]
MSKDNTRKTSSVNHKPEEKGKIENQNQTHNSRREGMGPNTKRRPE